MAISLESIEAKLHRRLRILDGAFDQHIIEPSLTKRVDISAFREGLNSALWQSWGVFCREVLIQSTKGAVTRAGILTTSLHSARPEPEITFIAKQLATNNSITNIRALSGSHLEPTWGAGDTINRIINGINMSNKITLLPAFGVMRTIKDLRLCRNASAHVCASLISEVRSARVRYSETKFRHPSDMMIWVDVPTKDFLWKSWVEEMKIIAHFASA